VKISTQSVQLIVLIIILIAVVSVSLLFYFSLGHGTQVQTGITGETTSFKAGLPSINRTP